MTLFYIFTATFIISLLSLVRVLLISKNTESLQKTVFLLVGLSTGTLLGGAFLHLIPESLEHSTIENVVLLIVISFAIFFLIEKLLHWNHRHDESHIHHSPNEFGYMNLLGDGVHNFIDGLIIAASFSVSVELGVVSSIAIALHEIPQEIGDFGVLVYSGFSKNKAILYNFLSAVAAIAGGVLGYFFLSASENLLSYLLPIAAGGFLYISTSDLIPEIRRETDLTKSLKSFALFILGLLLMYVLR